MRAKGKFPFSDFMLIINHLEIAISIPVALNSTKTVSGFVDRLHNVFPSQKLQSNVDKSHILLVVDPHW